jgi:hypothetical protein
MSGRLTPIMRTSLREKVGIADVVVLQVQDPKR